MQPSQPLSRSHSVQHAAGRVAAVLPALLAVLLGVFILWGVGLAGADLLHNAAHDTRHGLSFPCH